MVLSETVSSVSAEQRLLSSLLAALRDPTRAAELPTSDARLLAIARHHRLTPLLSALCADRLPEELKNAARRDRLLTTAHNLGLAHAAGRVLAAFAREGIPTIVLKGLDYEARLYGMAGARPTADVDFMVPDSDRRRAFAVLDRLRFEPRAAAAGFDESDYHEVAWQGNGVEIDLHMGLAPTARCRIDYRAVWAQAEPAQLGEAETRVLSRPHAAVFHALHMAIDHFEVPAIYLVDLGRLLPAVDDFARAVEIAGGWRCKRPLMTAALLTAAFGAGTFAGPLPPPSAIARRIVARYGGIAPLSRAAQLLRKFAHFDTAADAGRYTLVQARRNLREQLERRIRHRSARERLGLVSR